MTIFIVIKGRGATAAAEPVLVLVVVVVAVVVAVVVSLSDNENDAVIGESTIVDASVKDPETGDAEDEADEDNDWLIRLGIIFPENFRSFNVECNAAKKSSFPLV
jgi:hypothetical protein